MRAEYDDTCSVFRSHVDPRVWMCTIPMTDIIEGIQASTRLWLIKAYVEETAARLLDLDDGTWVKDDDGSWTYGRDAE